LSRGAPPPQTPPVWGDPSPHTPLGGQKAPGGRSPVLWNRRFCYSHRLLWNRRFCGTPVLLNPARALTGPVNPRDALFAHAFDKIIVYCGGSGFSGGLGGL